MDGHGLGDHLHVKHIHGCACVDACTCECVCAPLLASLALDPVTSSYESGFSFNTGASLFVGFVLCFAARWYYTGL